MSIELHLNSCLGYLSVQVLKSNVANKARASTHFLCHLPRLAVCTGWQRPSQIAAPATWRLAGCWV